MTNDVHKASSPFHTFLAAATDSTGSNPPAREDDEPRRPRLRRPWFVVALLLTVLFTGACIYLFFTWGLPVLLQLIGDLEEAGVRVV